MKKIIFAATTSNTGKTTISSGLMRALKNKGLQVQPFKVGPDYIDTRYHQLATGNVSRNLDEYLLPREEIQYLFAKNTQSADIAVVEGVMGLYDGFGSSLDYCSTAGMSKILDAPVILIFDGKSMAASAAALVLGFKELDRSVKIAGVIANNVSTDSHYQIIKKSVEELAKVPVLGRIPKDENFHLSSRHLGLTPSLEQEDLSEKLDYIAGVIEKHIDLDMLLEIAETKELNYDASRRDKIKNITDVKLGIAFDKAFNFYYQDALDLLEEMGVKFDYFSPLSDPLPENLDGLYLGGGYPEMFAKELSSNQGLMAEIREKSNQGMPIYAECGGLMYLGEQLHDLEGKPHSMTGILKGSSQMQNRLQRFGYCQGIVQKDMPIAKEGVSIKGHEFHYSTFDTKEQPVLDMQKTLSDGTLKTWVGGYQKENSFGSYLHTHFAGDYGLALEFVQSMERYRKNKK